MARSNDTGNLRRASQPAAAPQAGVEFQSDLGFRLWLPQEPHQLSMTEPEKLSLSADLEKGVVYVHAHPGSANTDESLRILADEFFRQMPPAPGQTLRPVHVPGADAAFATQLTGEVLGHVITAALMIARRDGDLVSWGVIGNADSEPARRFLSSFAFTERGVYVDSLRGFRAALPPGWEFLPRDDETVVLHRGHRATGQQLTIHNTPLHIDEASLDMIAEELAAKVAKTQTNRQLALQKQILNGRKTVDIWWHSTEGGRSGVRGNRWIVFPDRTLICVLTLPDLDGPTPDAQRMMESIQPLGMPVVVPGSGSFSSSAP